MYSALVSYTLLQSGDMAWDLVPHDPTRYVSGHHHLTPYTYIHAICHTDGQLFMFMLHDLYVLEAVIAWTNVLPHRYCQKQRRHTE